MKKTVFILAVIFLTAAGCASSSQTFYNPSPSVQKNASGTPVVNNNCPPGFIEVPGNALYHTTDFCVMKYDAKVALLANPTVGLQPSSSDPCAGTDGYHTNGTYKNSGPGCAATVQNGKEIISSPSGYPVTYIPETGNGGDNAKTYCQQKGWHLLTNDEWMTVARNVEQVAANWCSPDGTGCGATPGAFGKILANGHSHTWPDAALTASANDALACFGTVTDGSGACGGLNSQKRTLTLSNGQVIWDFAGNVWQWVDGSVLRKDEPKSKTNGKLDAGWLSSEFAAGPAASGVLPSVIIDNGQGQSLGYDSFRPSNPAWNSSNGVGRIFHYSAAWDSNTTVYGFIRGGQYNHGAVDGAFSMHLTPVPNKTNINDTGFRCTASPQ
ncbi:MAG: hypothetical protein KGJ93_04710 [Patescibacteria group bacterium]|nr:hypothetical protein [Patescibacteria group bacterium]